MRGRLWMLGLSGLIIALPVVSWASGSYARPVRPPIATIDVEKYHLGKQIFTGAPPPATGSTDGAHHSERLKVLQAQLPPHAQRSASLESLAGKLDNDQLAALEYYLAVRYKVGAAR